MRVGLLTGLILLALAAPASAARPCTDLRPKVVETALDYALERSSREEFATVLSSTVEIEVFGCYRLGHRRAAWKYRLRIVDDDTTADLLAEQGTLEVTPSSSRVHVRR